MNIITRLAERLPKGSLVLASVSVVNVALGFGREATIAYFFGTSAQLDTFLVALTIPKLLAVSFTQISVSVVLPLYIGFRKVERYDDATALVQKWFWFSGLIIATIGAVLFVGADLLMHLLAPGFDEARREESAGWLRLLLPYVWLYGIASVFTVVQNSHDRFFVPAVTNELISVTVILLCAITAQRLGVGAIATGFLGGSMIGFIWQLYNSRRFEPKLPSFARLRRDIKLPISAAVSMIFASTALQIGVLIDRSFASELAEGSIAAYNYAQMINSIPRIVITSSMSTALFPVLSRKVAGGDWKGSLRIVQNWTLILMSLGIIPVVLLIVFRVQVVSLILQRGAFDLTAVHMTSEVLTILPLMILLGIASSLYSQMLLSQMRARVLGYLAAVTLGAKVVANIILVKHYGILGIAMATLFAALITTSLKVIYAYRFQHA